MNSNKQLISQLKKLLPRKKGKAYYAKILGVSEAKINELYELIGRKPKENNIENRHTEGVVKYEENIDNGTGELIFNSTEEIKSLDDLIKKSKIDVTKWNISKYIQNYWGNIQNPNWQVKAWLSRKGNEQLFQDNFIKFLSNYKPSSRKILKPKQTDKDEACLVINKQDSHLNKKDNKNIDTIGFRGSDIESRVRTIVSQAKVSNDINTIKYIIGSDEFNSEWTNATTKGTPQENTDSYQSSFEQICQHEIEMIQFLLENCDWLEVIYVPGNHDEYVGWHMIKWLEAYFRNEIYEDRLSFDSETNYRKYVSFGTTAMMFNHGDAIKPAKLASIFPMEFRDEWSHYDHFYIFTGDKHHELSQDFNGIKFYQIPAFSKATGKWEDKHGYTCSKGEVTAFLIEMGNGMTNIFKQYL